MYELAEGMELEGLDIAEVFAVLGKHADLVFEALEEE